MIRWSKVSLILSLAIVVLGAVPAAGPQEKAPAKLQEITRKKPAEVKSAALDYLTLEVTGIATKEPPEWGTGVLDYKGKKYPFKGKGLRVAVIGLPKAILKGAVYDLADIGNFSGQYKIAEPRPPVFQGKEGALFKNSHGVYLLIKPEQQGINLSYGPEGLTIQMEEAH